MNIVVTVDDACVFPLRVMLNSLFLHNREKITVWLLCAELKEQNVNALQMVAAQHGAALKIYRVPAEFFREAPVLPNIPRVMYFRLLSAAILPEAEERALYLDPDILIMGSVSELYHTDFAGKLIIGIPDVQDGDPYVRKMGIKEPYHYINSGVLLLNLTLLRSRMDLSEILRLAMNPPVELLFPDQDIINLYFKKDIGYQTKKFNMLVAHNSPYEGYLRQFDLPGNPCILHWAGVEKPWKWNYYGKYFLLYDRYLLKAADQWYYKFWRLRYGYVVVMVFLKAIKRMLQKEPE